MMLAEPMLEDGVVPVPAPAPGCPLDARQQERLVTVVVTSGEHGDELGPVIAALLGSLDTGFEVLVVDDVAEDGTARQLVDAYRVTDARVRSVREPLPGRARARNTGLRFSRGGVVAFVDGGCIPERDWICAIRRAFDAHPNATFVLGRVVGAGDERLVSLPGAGTPGVVHDDEATVCQLGHRTDAEQLADFLAGRFGSTRNLAIQKAHLPDLWAFDTSLGPGSPAGAGDDVDAVLGGLLERWELVFDPGSVVRESGVAAATRAAAGPAVQRPRALGAIACKRALGGRSAALVRRAIQRAAAGGAAPDRPARRAGLRTWATLAPDAATYVRGRLRDSWRTA